MRALVVCNCTQCHIVMKPLIASPKMPTLAEMLENLNHAFPTSSSSNSEPTTTQSKLGIQIMVAEDELTQAGWEIPFKGMVNSKAYNMLCPFGDDNTVLIDGLLVESEQDEDEEEMDIRAPGNTNNNNEATAFVPTNPEALFEPDAEDLATDELLSTENSNATKYEAYLVIDGHEGGSMLKHKSSILCVFSNNNPNSTD